MIIHGLILAAGQSKRLGQPKQLVSYQGKPLIQHIEDLLLPLVDHLYVVLGHEHTLVRDQVQSATCLINPDWQLGMGHSLAFGAHTASQGADAVLIALCDQPKIGSDHYQQLLASSRQQPEKIIASQYAGTLGVPAVFSQPHFDALLQCAGQQGARQLIKQHMSQVFPIPCLAAAFDLDTSTQLVQLRDPD